MGTSPGIDWSVYETDHTSAFSSEVKSEWRGSYILPYTFKVCYFTFIIIIIIIIIIIN
jgi:hypothetical protein